MEVGRGGGGVGKGEMVIEVGWEGFGSAEGLAVNVCY